MTNNQPWVDAYIGLGSNLDDPVQQLLSASREIAAMANVKLLALSPLYASPPLGPQDQPDYVNAAIHLSTSMPALELLHALQRIENHHGRVRLQRWGARTLDLDLLLYSDQRIDGSELTVPHPQISQRAFVLYPLADIADNQLPIPGQGLLNQLLAACPADGLRRLSP